MMSTGRSESSSEWTPSLASVIPHETFFEPARRRRAPLTVPSVTLETGWGKHDDRP